MLPTDMHEPEKSFHNPVVEAKSWDYGEATIILYSRELINYNKYLRVLAQFQSWHIESKLIKCALQQQFYCINHSLASIGAPTNGPP